MALHDSESGLPKTCPEGRDENFTCALSAQINYYRYFVW